MLELIQIQSALKLFAKGDLASNALSFFQTLGYQSERQQPLNEKTFAGFSAYLNDEAGFSEKTALVPDWRYVDLLFQLTESELNEQQGLFVSTGIDDRITSYLFFVLELRAGNYSRTALSQVTREVNKVFPIPVMVLFKYGEYVTLAVIDRQPNKRDESKDVLRKVTLIKDIRFANPHRAHLEILSDLSLSQLSTKFTINNFLDLHQAWQKVLDTKELNKRFFKELANWYFWAVDNVTFPTDEEKDAAVRNATSVIRLITRLMFVWFLKEKGLVSDKLFDQRHLKNILNSGDDSTYYKAILQNLFFATLNSNMGERKFVVESSSAQDFVHNLFRYKEQFLKPEATIKELFEPIPFLNGGLFECLDKEFEGEDGQKKKVRVDGFYNHSSNVLRVPDELFFGNEHDVDLNEIYGTKNKKYKVRGLINLLNSYKFTIAENTPIEEEIALDPELLGKVFENLLANYNPETRTTARKQTGSFYTPREIVNYMVDESLIAYLNTKLQTETAGFQSMKSPQGTFGGNDWRGNNQLLLEYPVNSNRWQGKEDELETALRDLLGYERTTHNFNETETEILIKAIDTCKILDPACGSGAFPMGILLKLVHILEKLDPDNAKWREWQKQKAIEETKAAWDIGDKHEREQRLKEINEIFEDNSSDYGRKLFLIENCIYGVDIQPIAIQIAKLRFFISLIVDQDFNDDPASNRGIRPLPNLETKFVAANTLIGLEMSGLKPNGIDDLEKQLKEVRAKHFGARTRKTKEKYRLEDKRIRNEIADLLKQAGFPETSANQISGWNPYDQNAKADWFDAEWMFGIDKGFDIVIGNPPYGGGYPNYLKKYFRLAYKSARTIPNKQKGSLDTYSLFIEQGFNRLHKDGSLIFIIPISITSSDSMTGLHRLLEESCNEIKISSYAVRPQPVFQNAVVNTSILFFIKTETPAKRILMTKMYRKHKDISLDVLVKNLQFTDVIPRRLVGRYPKIGLQIEANILDKIFSRSITLGDLTQEEGSPIYYRTTGGRYYKVITPYSTGSTQETSVKFDARVANAIGAILSSSLFFWFYQIFSDNLHIKLYEIESFKLPIEQLTDARIEKLEKLYTEYLADIEANAQVRLTTQYANIDSFREYKIGKSKRLIDKIDRFIGPLYGLTEKEIQFIIDYDLEYRIEDDATSESSNDTQSSDLGGVEDEATPFV